MLLYYITDSSAFPGSERARRQSLLARIKEAGAAGVDYIQLRERDLCGRELEALAREAVTLLREYPGARLLVNSRVDVALAAGARGAHLRADDISAADARKIWLQARAGRAPIIAASCHSAPELARAEKSGADFAVLGPVFEKQNSGSAPLGIEGLKKILSERERSASSAMPVLALGGITAANAAECLRAGAAGIAGIRIFQQAELGPAVRALRKSCGQNQRAPSS